MAPKRKTITRTYTVEVRTAEGLHVRTLDGGLPNGLPDRHRAARCFAWWLEDNGHTPRAAASAAARALENEGRIEVAVINSVATMHEHEGRRR